MNNRLRLKDNIKINGKNFLISTVELPDIYSKYNSFKYETCIFKAPSNLKEAHSDVIMSYYTENEARVGHAKILENIEDYIW